MRKSLIAMALAGPLALLLVPAAGLGQPLPNPPPPKTLQIVGYGEVRATPNLATIKLEIVTDAKDSRDCAERNAAIAEKVVKALKAKLAGNGQVWTEDYTVTPQYQEYPPNYRKPRPETPPIIGYEARNIVGIRTPEVDSLGPLIDAAISAGATRFNSLDFALVNDRKARSEAVNDAALDAQAQVQALSVLGIKLKRALTVFVNVPQAPIYPYRPEPEGAMAAGAALATAANPATPIEANQAVITATVTITYEIE